MIFSVSSSEEEFSLPFSSVDLDVFCFFSASSSVTIPALEWFKAVQASLRIKRRVLILEVPRGELPDWNPSQRWQTGDNWSWLSPRALSSITGNHSFSVESYREFKSFLTSSK